MIEIAMGQLRLYILRMTSASKRKAYGWIFLANAIEQARTGNACSRWLAPAEVEELPQRQTLHSALGVAREMQSLRQFEPVDHPRGQDRPRAAHRVQPSKKGRYTRQQSLAFCRKTRQFHASLPPVEGGSFAFPEIFDDLHDLLQ